MYRFASNGQETRSDAHCPCCYLEPRATSGLGAAGAQSVVSGAWRRTCSHRKLCAAAGQADKDIAQTLRITPKKVARGRRRLTLGLVGLEKDAPRSGRRPSIRPSLIQRVVRMTTRETPPQATHWSTRTMAAAVGISPASVRHIWRRHGLKPHRVESFKISNDPAFVQKL